MSSMDEEDSMDEAEEDLQLDEEEEHMHLLVKQQQSLASVVLGSPTGKRRKIDHRSLPRVQKKNYMHGRAYQCIMYDYLGPSPLFDGREFETMFRISRSRFQCLMEDICQSRNSLLLRKARCLWILWC